VLKRNPGYAGPKPAFEDIKISFIPDPKTTELALRSHELDFAVLPTAVAASLTNAQGVSVDKRPGLAYVWLGMNMEKPPFNDLKVRQAIRLGLDVDQMLLAGFNGQAPRLNALIVPPILGNWPQAPVYQRNVPEAKRLLAEAGHPTIKTRLTILNQPVFQTMALVARALLQDIGVTVDVDVQEGATYWEAGKGDTGNNLDMFIMRFAGKLDPNFLMQWFVSSQIGVWNWQRFNSPEFDKLAQDAIVESDPAKRAKIVIEAQEVMDKSAAFIWLTNEVAFIAHRDTVAPAYLPGAIDWQLDHFTST
jgi:peptide/nickel transport system substrate-binding protein